MNGSACECSHQLKLLQWRQGDDWETSQAEPTDLLNSQAGNQSELSINTKICIILASAKEIRGCSRCRRALSKGFQMRERWWSDHFKKSNGYFGCETTRLAGQLTAVNTWAYFEVKQLLINMKYDWDKLNVFTRRVESTQQTFILLFDLNPEIRETVTEALQNFNPALLGNPYWPYTILLDAVANRQEAAVWRIRDQVRAIETDATPQTVPNPDYRRLHDIGRHTIHVCETLDVAVQTIESIQRHYGELLATEPDAEYSKDDQGVRAELEFYRGFIANLRHRSTSNEKRLKNEIQLAFNTVAQHNAGTSVEIGRAAQIDSSAMRTIAFVTLIFLPPTFISSVFSMSFFQCGDNDGWGMSNKFWIYWVFAVPTTIATVIVWQYWHNIFPGTGYKTAAIVGEEPIELMSQHREEV